MKRRTLCNASLNQETPKESPPEQTDTPKNRYDVDQEPIVISKPTSDIILKQEHPADVIALYWFYYYTAKWQKTNQAHATTSYTAKGLKWGQDRVRRTKKVLIDLKLIEDVITKNKLGKIKGHYIKTKFIWSKAKTTLLENQRVETHTLEKPEGGNPQRVENSEGNALSTIKGNALSVNSKVLENSLPEDFTNLSNHIFQKQVKQFPSRYRRYSQDQISSMKLEGAEVLFKLSRLDKYDFDTEIEPAIKWALQDSFWSKQIQSPASLRNKSKNNGSTKFDNIFMKFSDKPIGRRQGSYQQDAGAAGDGKPYPDGSSPENPRGNLA